MALKSDKLFEAMAPHLQNQGAALVQKIGAVFHFDITPDAGEAVVYTVDLKNGNGGISKGKQVLQTPLSASKTTVQISQGKLNPQVAFMQGKMKGNMAKASKFTPDVLPKPPKL